MTNSKFIEICKKYAEKNNLWLHPNNIKVIDFFYKPYKKYCIEHLLNEDDENNIYQWLSENTKNPDFMTKDHSVNFLGNDPTNGNKILALGKLRDLVNPTVEIIRGNTKELKEDIGHQISKLGYSYFFNETGNSLEFKDNKYEDLYIIEWHYDEDYKQENIVKRVCAKLGITQKELAEIMKINDVTVRNWSSKGQIPESSISFMECLIENKNLKKENEEIKQALSILKKYS